ncbi:MAG: FhaA domain-containing protein [Acidimicrobiales bacterium]
MGLAQFERRLERLVEGAFARASRAGLQPVEIGRRLAREMDLQRSLGVHAVMAPNTFTVALAPDDLARFESFRDALVSELAEAVREHARSEAYVLLGPVTVDLVAEPSLTSGVFLVAGTMDTGPDGGPPASLVMPDGSRVRIGPGPMTIGRLPECEIPLNDPNISRRHAEIRREGPEVTLVDLGSTNGTKVNGTPARNVRLNHGDRLTLGATTLVFEAS